MKKKYTIWLLIMLLMLAVFASACQSPLSEETEEKVEEVVDLDYNPADSPPLRVAITKPLQLNPLLNGNDTLFQVYHLVYESLITFDEHFDVEPLLAESWETDNQGMSVTFHLREDITWHDGEPFTPEDVIFTFQVLREQAGNLEYPNLYVNNLQQISDVRKTGDHSIRVSFTRPYSNALETLVFPILPHHLFTGSNRSLLNSDQFPLVGTGRYQVESYDMSRSMNLTYYPSYWDKKPYIEEIEVVIVPDRQAQLSLFESGEIDLVEPLSVDWLKFTDHDGVGGITYPSTQYEFIGFNFRDEFWQARDVRQAVAHAIDREAMIRNIYFGNGLLSDVPVLPASWLHDDTRELVVRDVERAKEYMAGVELPEEAAYTLLTNEGNPLRLKTAELIADSLAEIGLTITVETLEWNALGERLAAGDFDLVLTGWQFSLIPDLSFAFHSTQEEMGNFIGYNHETMDRLLEGAFAAPTRQLKEEAWDQIQEHLATELPYISLLFKEHALLHRSTLRGELEPTQFNIFRGIETAYLIRPREAADSEENN